MIIAELIEASTVLQRLNEKRMPAKLAYALAKNIKMVKAEMEVYETTRIKLLSDNWELDQEKGQYNIPDDEKPRWTAMFNELIQGEANIDPYMVHQDLLNSIELTPSEIMAISWMIEEGD